MKLLLAVDGSSSSDSVIREVLSRPWPADTRVRLLYIKKPVSFSSDFVDVESYVEPEANATLTLVEHMVCSLTRKGLQVSTAILKGNPQKTLVKDAARWGADLILIGAESSEKFMRLFHSNLAKEVIRTAPCSVEVVREPSFQATPLD
ncbi:MAG: universal stress protein [Acidobacteria bacterium]|nr:universal stress protein [Acidobacteriota bacterium]